MKQALTLKRPALYHIYDDVLVNGKNSHMTGDCSGLRGDCTWLSGDCSGLSGECTGLYGDCSGLSGNLDECELSEEERSMGVYIKDLIKEEGK